GDFPEGMYPGTCASLTPAQVEEKRRSGRRPALRVRAGAPDDFVVRRNDGDFGYNLAVVVDDAEQGIDEVVRGADLLDSTPRQLWLFDQLSLKAPATYIHVPLMLGDDGARLAKRHGAVTLEQRVAAGATPSQLVAEMARSVGLESGDEATPAELLAGFSWNEIPTGA
ncbi:MAG: glutamate--tRNA ligase family protein, partial [Actinomycetota bacterium]|nr:glutamate--tRNA ligase family protein [Actinomycetota bacterium]